MKDIIRIIIYTMMLSIFASTFAEDSFGIDSKAETGSENKHLFNGIGAELGYVGLNMWAGLQFSNGPCIQPLMKFSFWKFNVGVYANMMGSGQDRIKVKASDSNSEDEYKSGKAARGFGMVDEIQFFIEGGNTWKRFSLDASFWYLAYTESSNDESEELSYLWWGDNTGGELTISPSFKIGPVTLYTDQCVQVIAKQRDEITSEDEDLNVSKGSAIGAYHATLGARIDKEMETLSLGFAFWGEYATTKFLKPLIWGNLKDEISGGFYHVTMSTQASYNINPRFTLNGYFNVQFVTNEVLNKSWRYDGCVPYGGLALGYSWDRK